MKRTPHRRISLKNTITRYYVGFFMFIIVSMFLSAALVRGFATLLGGGFFDTRLEASTVVRRDYTRINADDILRAGGWVEILKDGNVVYVIGTKGDDVNQYDTQSWGLSSGDNLMQLSANFLDNTYFYSTSLFSGRDGGSYLCLVKIPRANVERQLNWYFSVLNPRMSAGRVVGAILLGVVGSFLALFMLCVFFYSRLTTKKIAAPLDQIADGLARVTQGDLAVRLDFEAEREFAQIRDAFNTLAERLQSAEREKAAMEEEKKRLLMGISHDLKTPVTTVYGYAKALSDGMVTDPERQQRHLHYIRDKAQTMTKLIDDLFQYSALEGTGFQLHCADGDFAEFVRELIAENYLEIENHGVALEADIPEANVPLCFDGAQMGRALTNILGNALKYNPAGTALTVQLTDEGDAVTLVIADDGVGIAPAIRETLFDDFVRGDAERPSDGGSGLGLAIARRIVRMHGGDIALQPAASHGSCFVLRLPRK